jgi:phosphohistidine phosphatase SixA
MAIDKRSKVRDIEHVPGVIGIIKKHTGQEMAPAMFKMAAFMTLQSAAKQAGWSDEQMQACIDDINAVQEGK